MVVFLNYQTWHNNTVVFKNPLFQFSLCTVGYLCATSKISLAQVTTDNTINTQVDQNGNVAEITGGETREGNLYLRLRSRGNPLAHF